ncbi:MAG: dual specificity protein phosphatase family protein, partial [Chlamydiia bacterium]|nr:dual specificity protein phosphatase family protein [Chlamydiia bacterium]
AGKCRQRVPNYEEKAKELKQRGITHIVCCTEDSVHYHEGKFSYYNVTLTDTDDADITSHLDGAYQFIEKAIKEEGRVLVHCGAGVSRSASVVIAYLMKKEGADYQSTFNFVKTKRPCVNPNRGFVRQLQSYNKI